MKAALKRIVAGSSIEPALRIWWRRLRVHEARGRSSADNAIAVAVMRRILRPDSNWLEVGASTGEMLWHVMRYAPRGRHQAFEPVPVSAARLRAEFGSRIQIHEVACSDRSGESEFQYVTGDAGYSGLRRRSYPRADMRVETIRVRTARLDDLVPADHAVHAMKIDVEGAEGLVLDGARGLLARCRPYVLFEHGTGAAEAYGLLPGAVWDFFDAAHYDVTRPADWLHGRGPLTREAFAAAFAAGECNYLGVPR